MRTPVLESRGRLARRPWGFTLIEALITMGIIGLLVALLLPAVQQARSASQAIRCRSNLHQLAQATHAYHASHGMLPGYMQIDARTVPANKNSFHSLMLLLLPHLEQDAVYDLVNMEIRFRPAYLVEHFGIAAQTTAGRVPIGVFACPADPLGGIEGRINYRGNWGVGPMWAASAEFPDSENGVFSTRNGGYVLRLEHILDGLSATAMFSERLVGSNLAGAFDARRDALSLPDHDVHLTLHDAPTTTRTCDALSRVPGAGVFVFGGRHWIEGGLHSTLYNHAIPLDASFPDCQAYGHVPPIGATTPSAEHGASVHVAFADGAVRVVPITIDVVVWRAMGSRNGKEIVLDL